MNRDDIIRMVNKAGGGQLSDRQFQLHGLDTITNFAALVAFAERESLRESFRVVTAAEASAAILHEREACAKMLEAASKTGKIISCTSAAKAIRSRGQA